MGNLLFEGLNVDERHKNNGASELRGIKRVDELFKCDDGGLFRTVGARDKSQDRTALFAIDDDDGHIGSGVDTCWDLQIAG